jgi:hypothetical protein
MTFANARTIRIAGGVLVGGLVTGMLLAMAMPTQMSRKAETWRDLIGLREVTAGDAAIPVYAPPQDLTPVHWQTAAEEYPALPKEETALDAIYPGSDAGYQADLPYEPLPPELTETNDTSLAVADDEAAASAQAASAAADDVQAQVQAQESETSDPAGTIASMETRAG